VQRAPGRGTEGGRRRPGPPDISPHPIFSGAFAGRRGAVGLPPHAYLRSWAPPAWASWAAAGAAARVWSSIGTSWSGRRLTSRPPSPLRGPGWSAGQSSSACHAASACGWRALASNRGRATRTLGAWHARQRRPDGRPSARVRLGPPHCPGAPQATSRPAPGPRAHPAAPPAGAGTGSAVPCRSARRGPRL
jgi:hypothetical protein